MKPSCSANLALLLRPERPCSQLRPRQGSLTLPAHPPALNAELMSSRQQSLRCQRLAKTASRARLGRRSHGQIGPLTGDEDVCARGAASLFRLPMAKAPATARIAVRLACVSPSIKQCFALADLGSLSFNQTQPHVLLTRTRRTAANRPHASTAMRFLAEFLWKPVSVQSAAPSPFERMLSTGRAGRLSTGRPSAALTCEKACAKSAISVPTRSPHDIALAPRIRGTFASTALRRGEHDDAQHAMVLADSRPFSRPHQLLKYSFAHLVIQPPIRRCFPNIPGRPGNPEIASPSPQIGRPDQGNPPIAPRLVPSAE